MGDDEQEHAGDGNFPMTRWTLVGQALGGSDTEADSAMAELCQAYWPPIYAFLRREGANKEDAADLTQDFFQALLSKGFVASADRKKGKLRTFLLACLKNYRSMDYRAKNRQKRGGGAVHLAIDLDQAEGGMKNAVADTKLGPDEAFDRAWARHLLETVMRKLEASYLSSGGSQEWNTLKSCLSGKEEGPSYAELGAQLGASEGNIKVKVHRMRKRYRQLLEEEVGQTLEVGSEDVGRELRHLLRAL